MQSMNQTANLGRGMSGPVCVNYYCTPPEQSFEFWNASIPQLRELSFNFTKTITKTDIVLDLGNKINRIGYQACMHITNARIEDSTLIKFVITYNSNEESYTFINLVVKGKLK